MGRSYFRQATQILKSDTYDDTLAAGATLQSGVTTIEGDLNAIRSQVKRILGTANWYTALTGRDLDDLSVDLADLEGRKVLFRTLRLTDVVVTAAQNWEILSVAGSEAPAEVAAVATSVNGAVVAQSALSGAGFNVHELIEIAGLNAVSPKNLVYIVDAANGAVLQSAGRDILGLLQYESTGVDGAAFNDTSAGNRVKISFVRFNAGRDDLEACPVGDIAGLTVNFSYVRRINLDAIPEDAFLTGSQFVDEAGSTTVNLDTAIDGQGATPATQSTDIRVQIADTKRWDFEDSAGADLLSVQANAAGTSVVEVGAAADSFLSSAAANTFTEGLTADNGGTPIRVGVTAGYVDTASADLGIRAGGELYLDDSNQTGSTWAQTAGVKLSDTSGEWDNYETEFGGEVSILRAIYLASVRGKRSKTVAVVTTTSPADTNMTGAGGSPNLDVQLPDYSAADFIEDVDVFVNGQLMRNGANSGANHDVYPGTTPANGDLKFEFALNAGSVPDVITMVIFSGQP